MTHYTEIHFFVLFYQLKNAFTTSFHLSFLFTNKQAVLSSAQTDQSWFSFPPEAGFRHKIKHALTGADFWHQKNLPPKKYGRLPSFWYQLTGTRNRRQNLASVSSLLGGHAQWLKRGGGCTSAPTFPRLDPTATAQTQCCKTTKLLHLFISALAYN